MIQNYFKIAVRNLKKHKLFSLINFFGLTIGMAAGIIILLHVSFELSYDDFHEDSTDIYRVTMNESRDGVATTGRAKVYGFIAEDLQENFPEVMAAGRIINLSGIMGNFTMGYQDKQFALERAYYGDPSLFRIFSFKAEAGNLPQALAAPFSVVVTESFARKFFGEESPLGKTLIQNGGDAYQITAIIADIRENSHLQFECIFSLSSLEEERIWQYMPGWADWLTYIRLTPDTDPNIFLEKMTEANIVANHLNNASANGRSSSLDLQPLGDIHLYSHLEGEASVNGNATLTFSLLIIAFFILLIAWINYINLATARSMERAREVGIRKVVGAQRQGLIMQFVLESLLLNVIAAALAVLLVRDQLPFFAQLLGHPLEFSFYGQHLLWGILAMFFIAGVVLSSIYPAWVLSAHQPIAVLKGSLSRGRQTFSSRKALIIFQFAASIVLITMTAAIYQQINFMRSKSLGVNIDQTLIVAGPAVVGDDYISDVNGFRNDLTMQSAIKSTTVSTNIPGRESTWGGRIRLRNAESATPLGADFMGIDYNFIDAYEMRMLEGRAFSEEFPSDESAVILNESAARQLGFTDYTAAIGEVALGWRNREFEIIGVMADHHQLSLHEAMQPTVYFLRKTGSFYSIKLQSNNIASTIEMIQARYDAHFPGNPFDFYFLDSYFDRQYRADYRFGQVFSLFSGLAILIACLGLFAFSAFTASRRTREVGIRKVLGASSTGIFQLLSKDFLRIILIAALFALPATLWLVNAWLENYAFRISPGLLLFTLPPLLVLMVALFTVSIQAVKSALINPVEALRHE